MSQLMQTPSTTQVHRLDQMKSGTHGIVSAIETNDVAIQRLMAMGLCVGRRVEVVRHGNPLIIRMLGARIGLSDRLAQRIVLESCSCAGRCRP